MQTSNAPSKNALVRQNAGTATNNSDDSKTSADTNARPWATTVVFKSDGDDSASQINIFGIKVKE